VPLTFFRDGGFELMKRSEALGMITRSSKAICFSGTHGKTTTSSMAAHIMHTAKIGCNAFLGGILRNYNSNLLLSETSPYTVVEADEYDRSFHRLSPYIAVVTATDPDHLDIYGTEEAYLESFAHFTELIANDGTLIVHTGLKLRPRPQAGVKVYTYSRDEGDFHAANIRRGNGTIMFDFVANDGTVINDIELGVPVEINIENAVAAIAACYVTGTVDAESIRNAMASFKGAERRFQFWLKEPVPGGHVIIDDYAHHPDEVRQSIASVKALYPGKKLAVAFQPHLYSRTRDFAPQFAEALSAADTLVLCNIYPAREEPIPGVTSKIIFDDVKSPEKMMICKENLVNTIKNINFDILLTLGAGDINNYLPELVQTVKTQS
jgi:UDP-N-acetylmuramate--alanine ligase